MFARSKQAEGERLPQGAEAALWSIVEVIPDPRNHLALTRDPTCEIRLSAAQIEAAAVAPVPTAAASASAEPPSAVPTPGTPLPVRTTPTTPAPVPLATGVRWSDDAAEVRHPAPVSAPPAPMLDIRPSPLSVVSSAPAAPAGPTEEQLIRELFAESA